MERANVITQSADADLLQITRWLEEEEAAYERDECERGFLCNIGVMHSCHEEGQLYVLRHPAHGAVAFAALGPATINILEVRPDLRGTGLGAELARFCIALAANEGANTLWVDCQPVTSQHFWNRMGFVSGGRKFGSAHPAYYAVRRELPVPQGSTAVDLVVEAHSEDRIYGKPVDPVGVFTPEAWKSADGRVHLSERLLLDDDLFDLRMGEDLALLIRLDGKVLLENKAKYPEAQRLGVERDYFGVFFIDSLTPA